MYYDSIKTSQTLRASTEGLAALVLQQETLIDATGHGYSGFIWFVLVLDCLLLLQMRHGLEQLAAAISWRTHLHFSTPLSAVKVFVTFY